MSTIVYTKNSKEYKLCKTKTRVTPKQLLAMCVFEIDDSKQQNYIWSLANIDVRNEWIAAAQRVNFLVQKSDRVYIETDIIRSITKKQASLCIEWCSLNVIPSPLWVTTFLE